MGDHLVKSSHSRARNAISAVLQDFSSKLSFFGIFQAKTTKLDLETALSLLEISKGKTRSGGLCLTRGMLEFAMKTLSSNF